MRLSDGWILALPAIPILLGGDIARRRLSLDVRKFLEKIPDRLLVVPVHGKQLRLSRRAARPRDSRDAL
jgi:hypothetical protein